MVLPASENVMLKAAVPWLVMISVPIRNQSGAKFTLRIQACKSGLNGVPGATIGFGAARYKKSPPVTWASGRKK